MGNMDTQYRSCQLSALPTFSPDLLYAQVVGSLGMGRSTSLMVCVPDICLCSVRQFFLVFDFSKSRKCHWRFYNTLYGNPIILGGYYQPPGTLRDLCRSGV